MSDRIELTPGCGHKLTDPVALSRIASIFRRARDRRLAAESAAAAPASSVDAPPSSPGGAGTGPADRSLTNDEGRGGNPGLVERAVG